MDYKNMFPEENSTIYSSFDEFHAKFLKIGIETIKDAEGVRFLHILKNQKDLSESMFFKTEYLN